MSTLLQAIGEILRPSLASRGPIRLEEGGPGSTCEAIHLHRSGQALVLRPDRAGGPICPRSDCNVGFSAPDRLLPMFRLDVPGLAVMCDYIVFCQETSGEDARLFVLLCELKSGNVGGSRKQIENGRLLADYILEMAILHQPVQSLPSVQRRALVFSPKFAVPKGSLLKGRCVYTPKSERFPDMPFAYYACGAGYPLEHFLA